ncbi:MAG: hypothetical protein U9Q85_03575 [Patescibacteria group bacterium]|nr:hypothetical protein [Patescibacteria group bacterium]
MIDADREVLSEENYVRGFEKLVEEDTEAWANMVVNDEMTISGNNPTFEVYCHLCHLGQKSK